MAKTRDIQRRIKSVNNTKKITRAMEMVAAAKMRKAIEAVLRTRTYANLSWATVLNLSRALNNSNGGYIHPLLVKRENIKKVGIILIASNRGLCGGFNAALIDKTIQSVKKYQYIGENEEIKTDFILLGKKGSVVYRQFGYNIAADFPKNDLATGVGDVISAVKMAVDGYLSGGYDKIMVAYTDFVSASKQVPRVKQLLPVDITTDDEYLGIVSDDTRLKVSKEFLEEKQDKYLKDEKYVYEYIFEPGPKEVLDEIIPRLLEVQLYQALLEANASEHSARMAAMHQATDAARDMVDELTLFYNKARQASITAEIAEISAGANALK